MASLYGKGWEREDGFELKASSSGISGIAQAVHRQFKLVIHLIHWRDGPKEKAHAVLNKSYLVCSLPR